MSLSRPRFLATSLAAAWLALGAIAPFSLRPVLAASAGTSANTWSLLAPLPESLHRPVFALAVSPADPRVLLAGTGAGNLYRSSDGGLHWSLVARGLGRGVLTVAFDPLNSSQALAGTEAQGVWQSTDTGRTWTASPGATGLTARAFGFARALTLAGTDQGVLARQPGGRWQAAGLGNVSLDAVAVAAINQPARLLVGGDAAATQGLPLFESADAATTWKPLRNPNAGSLVVSALAGGSLMANQPLRPLLLGTNAGAFLSTDNGSDWTPVAVPATDVTQAAFVSGHSDRFYLASDGGGSERGGLWYSGDSGASVRDLKPPLPEVSALAVSTEDKPTLYIATFRPLDHAVMLWSYHDTGGAPQGPANGVPPPAHSVQTAAAPPAASDVTSQLTRAELPYLALGAACLVTLLLALIAYVARGRPRRA